MRDVVAVIGFVLLQFVVLALIGARQEYRRRKNRLRHTIGDQHDPVEGD